MEFQAFPLQLSGIGPAIPSPGFDGGSHPKVLPFALS